MTNPHDKAVEAAAKAVKRKLMEVGRGGPDATYEAIARETIAAYEAAMWRPVNECPEEWKDGRSLLAERAFDGNYKTDLPTYFEVRWRTDGFNFTGFMDFQGRRINVARLRPLPTVSADYDDNVRRAKTQTFKPLRRPTPPEGK